MGSSERHVAGVNDHVGLDPVEVRKHGLECCQVAMHIGDYRDPHRPHSAELGLLWAPCQLIAV